MLNVFKTALIISWGWCDMPALLFFMKDCYVLVKEEGDHMKLRDLKQFFISWKKPHQTNPPKTQTKPWKKKLFFFTGEFWNVQTKQLFFQLLQVLNNSKKILRYDLSQEIILSGSWWTAGFIASPAIVILNFSTCYLHNGSSKFQANSIKIWNNEIADV